MCLPIDPLTKPVYLNGKIVEVDNVNGKGFLNVLVSVPSQFRNICSWFFELRTNIFGYTNGQKLWVILSENKLLCYDGPHGSESKLVREIECSSITEVNECNYKQTNNIIDALNIVTREDGSVILGFGDDSYNIRGFWRRALCNFNRF